MVFLHRNGGHELMCAGGSSANVLTRALVIVLTPVQVLMNAVIVQYQHSLKTVLGILKIHVSKNALTVK